MVLVSELAVMVVVSEVAVIAVVSHTNLPHRRSDTSPSPSNVPKAAARPLKRPNAQGRAPSCCRRHVSACLSMCRRFQSARSRAARRWGTGVSSSIPTPNSSSR